jgi:spoIIIJ-associated protein
VVRAIFTIDKFLQGGKETVDSIEASGKSVEEAINQALIRLGKRRDEVEIAVLQEPSRGTFGLGLGSREARVRVTVLPTTSPSPKGAVITPEMADALLGPGGIEVPLPDNDDELYEEEEEEDGEDEEYEDEEEEEEDGEYEDEEELDDEELDVDDESVPFVTTNAPTIPAMLPGTPVLAEITSAIEALPQQGGEMPIVENPTREDIEITVDVLQHILRYMSIHATIQVRATNPLTLNINGMRENLGLLIGRRGETLAALQLLVNLIVSHRTKHRMRIIVDAENYRQRREENLRSLALRVAQQVRNYRRSIALEAMPPHERRIVHIALSETKDISTESIGEGDERRVVISLKRPVR